MSHDQRCEQSRSPNQRCRCECQGRKHGIQAVRQRLAVDEPAEETSSHD